MQSQPRQHKFISLRGESLLFYSFVAEQSAAMTQKTVIKVNIYCQICKSDVLKAVTTLTNIDQVSMDGEKGTLTVIGEVDPVLGTKKLRKIGKVAELVTVEPLKPPEPEKPKPNPAEPEKPKPPVCPLPPCCNDCQNVAYRYVYYPYNDDRICSIL